MGWRLPIRGIRAAAAALAVAAPCAAHAADATYMPPAMTGDVVVGWSGEGESSDLLEDGASVGTRRASTHSLWTGVEFAPIDQIAVWLAFDAVVSRRLVFEDVVGMSYDPISGSGTYLDGAILDPAPEWKGSGLAGVWFGVAAAPFAERFGNGDRATWRLDLGVRTPGRPLWSAEGERRGAAPGGVGWMVSGAFSTRYLRAEPYLELGWRAEGRRTIDVVGADGVIVASGVEIKAPHQVEGRLGGEFVLHEDRRVGSAVALDLHLGWTYVAWQDTPSGFLLPSVLTASEGLAVTASEHVEGRAGGGFVIAAAENIRISLGGDGVVVSPWRVDSAYAVRASVGAGFEGHASLRVGYR